MQPMKKKAVGNVLQKMKASKPIGKLTPSPKTIGNPRTTQPVISPQANIQAQQFSPQPVMNEAINRFVPNGGNPPAIRSAVMPGVDIEGMGQSIEMPSPDMMQPENARQSAMARMMMMRKMKVKQSPLNKFKRIGIPEQPAQQQGNPQELYMQRMMQQMQMQNQGRFQF